MYGRVALFILLIHLAISSTEICYSDELKYSPDQIIVKFSRKSDKTRFSTREKNEILSKNGCGYMTKEFKRLPDTAVVKLPQGKKVDDAISALQKSHDVLYVEPDYKIVFCATFPNDPDFLKLWGLHNTGQEHPVVGGGTTHGIDDADIDAPEAWDIHTGAGEVIVAVIDSGIDYSHPDLAANVWINEAELDGDPNSDDDSNGYIDDIVGYDFGSNDSDPIDDYLHGTHVAGIIGAVGNNGIGVSGVCWRVKLMALNIDTHPFDWGTYCSNGIEAISYAVDNGARIMNASWRILGNSQLMKDAIEDAK